MNHAAYDAIADQYASSVHENLTHHTSVLAVATQSLLATLGDVSGKDVCDLCCGEGHLSLALAERARSVAGIDLSSKLIQIAQQKAIPHPITFVVDDAQALTSQQDTSFDSVVSNLALMDVPDLQAVYHAVKRVLRPSGRFVFSLTHPCFQTPSTRLQLDDKNKFVARQISAYTQEGFWRSDNPNGIRGQVGAYHRMLSTYLNTAIQTGFMLEQLVEPTPSLPGEGDVYGAAQMEVPAVLIVSLQTP